MTDDIRWISGTQSRPMPQIGTYLVYHILEARCDTCDESFGPDHAEDVGAAMADHMSIDGWHEFETIQSFYSIGQWTGFSNDGTVLVGETDSVDMSPEEAIRQVREE